MDWKLQKVLYEYALSKGFQQDDLNRIFQYPAKRGVRTGIIRWARGHDDHIHVRFRCPKEDSSCQ
jgi:murein endopeptidase